MLTFLHISDTHISADPHYHLHEMHQTAHHPNRGVELLLQAIRQLPFDVDFILHTGDVCADPQAADYRLARKLLLKFDHPMYLLPGNHDSADLMVDILHDGARLHVLRDDCTAVKDHVLLTLDSNQSDDRHAPSLQESQIDWFADALKKTRGQPVIVAVHHPLLPSGVDWVDRKMRVQNGERIQAILTEYADSIGGVFHGHLHQPMASYAEGVLYSGAASAWYSLQAYPGLEREAADLVMRGGFSLVVIHDNRTFIRRHALPPLTS